jgi:hypothetical protein
MLLAPLTPSTPVSTPSMTLMPLDTCSFGGVTLGGTDANGVEWFFLDIDGWGGTQSSVAATQKTAGEGAFVTPAFHQPRTLTVTGAIFAPNRPALIRAKDTLNGTGIQKMPLTVVEGGISRYVYAMRQSDVHYKETSDVSVEFSIQFLCPDYRKFDSTVLTASTGLPSSSGGLSIPFTIPFTISSVVNPGTCTLTSAGNTPGPAICRFSGPLAAPQVTHTDANGNVLTWSSSITLGASDVLEVNMDDGAHTVILNGTAPRDQYTTSRQWPTFTPGVNVWALAATSGSGLLTVVASAAYE